MLGRLASVFPLLLAVPASALEVKPCADASVGIGEIVQPVERSHRAFSGGRVSVYAIDTVEPVCCAGGVAIVMPDPADEVGANKCLAIVGVASVQLEQVRAEEESEQALRLSIPTRVFDGSELSVAGEPIKLRIDVESAMVELD